MSQNNGLAAVLRADLRSYLGRFDEIYTGAPVSTWSLENQCWRRETLNGLKARSRELGLSDEDFYCLVDQVHAEIRASKKGQDEK